MKLEKLEVAIVHLLPSPASFPPSLFHHNHSSFPFALLDFSMQKGRP